MAIGAGYVPAVTENDPTKLARAIRNLFENGMDSTAVSAAIAAAIAADNITDAANLAAAIAAIPAGGGTSGPQGRLTLQTGVPVMVSTQSGKTTIYYTPYVGRMVPLYGGSSYTMTDIGGELSQATTDTTKSPAAVGNNSNYDLFVWSDGGTYRCTRGPAWSTDTTRGTGAGTTELELVQGIYLNKVAITNGPTANRGTYVGTVRSNGSAQIDWIFGALAAGGTAGFFGVWNMYNRRRVTTMVADSTDLWTYGTATWRPYNNSTANRVSFVFGMSEDGINVIFSCLLTGSTGTINAVGGIGIDSTTAFSGSNAWGNITNVIVASPAVYSGLPGLGFHYAQALEYAVGGTATFYGDIGVTYMQEGFHASFMA